MTPTNLRLGTRQSALAQAQAKWVVQQLHAAFPDIPVEIVSITTSGDQGKAGASDNLKAAFTKEIEEALLEDRIDLAVHSLKDLAAELPKGLVLAAVPAREDPHDVWIGKDGVHFKDVRKGARVATGAVRRQAQLKHLRADLEIVPIRGNVDTRLQKMKDEGFDGMILALAGLKRLGRSEAVTEVLPVETMVPAIGQGALAIETRQKDPKLEPFLKALDHPASHQAAIAERAFLKALGGNCQTPVAAHTQMNGDRLMLTGLVVALSGDPYIRAVNGGQVKEAAMVGQHLAHTLLSRGADKVLT